MNPPPETITIKFDGSARMPDFANWQPKHFLCPTCGDVTSVFSIIRVNERFETIYEHHYCLECYDAFLQKHLPILKEVTPE